MVGNRNLFIGAAFLLLIATIFSFTATTFNVLLVSRIAAGIANGFMIAVATQLFLATYEGKAKMIGALNTVAANIGGLCLGLLANSLFTEDYGWQFTYYLSVPVLVVDYYFLLFLCSCYPKKRRDRRRLDKPDSFFYFNYFAFFFVLFREQYQGLSNFKMLLSAILAVVSAAVLLIRGFLHKKPLFDTRLLQYPGLLLH